jgi:AraC-like DNA-binding protein
MEDQQKKIVINLLAYAAQRDISASTLCNLAGISNKELQDKEVRLTPEQVASVWANAIYLSKDPYFGLHFGESLQLAALGIVGDIIRTSGTVGVALETAAAIVPLITDAFSLTITRSKNTFAVNFIPYGDDWETFTPVVQVLDLLMVFVIHEMDGLLLKKIAPIAVYYPRQITEIYEYERVMRCKPVAGLNSCAIIFDHEYWNEPIITANYELQKLLMQSVPSLKSGAKSLTFSEGIYNYLLNNSYLGMVSLETIAANFNLSTRTIQRKLKDEGSSFHLLTDRARKELALNYLKAGNVQVKQIGHLLGYNEVSSFNRTFKRWTGSSPGGYVKAL